MIEYIPFSFPGLENIGCLFTTRNSSSGERFSGNLSEQGPEETYLISQKKEILMNRFQIDFWQELVQVHGTDMIFLTKDNLQGNKKRPQGDALATSQPKIGLVIQVADCQPILLAHRSGGYIAALHVGWRANRAKAILKWVKILCQRYELIPSEISAIRGPSLGPDKSEFINFRQEWGEEYTPYLNKKSMCLNLWKLTKDQLIQAGIREDNIFQLDLCTYSLPELFFSFRRDKTQQRQAGIVWIK